MHGLTRVWYDAARVRMGTIIVTILLVYLSIGLIVASLFWSGLVVHRDTVYQRTPRRVRLVLVPGFAVLWPVMLVQRGPKGDAS